MPPTINRQNPGPLDQVSDAVKSVSENVAALRSSLGVDHVSNGIGGLIKRNPVSALMIGVGIGCYVGRRWGA